MNEPQYPEENGYTEMDAMLARKAFYVSSYIGDDGSGEIHFEEVYSMHARPAAKLMQACEKCKTHLLYDGEFFDLTITNILYYFAIKMETRKPLSLKFSNIKKDDLDEIYGSIRSIDDYK